MGIMAWWPELIKEAGVWLRILGVLLTLDE